MRDLTDVNESRFEDALNERRAKKIAKREFDYSGPLDEDDVSIEGSRGTAVVDTSGYLDDDEFDDFTEQAKESKALDWNPMKKRNRVKKSALDRIPDPRDVHQSRSPYAQRQDEAREAKLTTDPEKYASNPDRYDYPLVDTPDHVDEDILEGRNPLSIELDKSGEELTEKYL